MSLTYPSGRVSSAGRSTPSGSRQMAGVDCESDYGLIALLGSDHRPVGHGAYADLGEGQAEVAFAVADDPEAAAPDGRVAVALAD